jgi:hypothetical protein
MFQNRLPDEKISSPLPSVKRTRYLALPKPKQLFP